MLKLIEEWNTADDGQGTDMITLECTICGHTQTAPSGSDVCGCPCEVEEE